MDFVKLTRGVNHFNPILGVGGGSANPPFFSWGGGANLHHLIISGSTCPIFTKFGQKVALGKNFSNIENNFHSDDDIMNN